MGEGLEEIDSTENFGKCNHRIDSLGLGNIVDAMADDFIERYKSSSELLSRAFLLGIFLELGLVRDSCSREKTKTVIKKTKVMSEIIERHLNNLRLSGTKSRELLQALDSFVGQVYLALEIFEDS
ncbi:MAG: hypothetical protein WC846_04640 [Candidatus Gracilibacteria bacterium]|jgi:hypothetical protein